MTSGSDLQPLLGTKEGPLVAKAYTSPLVDKRGTASRSVKITLVALDCLFLGLQPVLVHLSKNAAGGYSFKPVAVNFLVELAKTLFALITLIVLGTGRPGAPMYQSLRSFIVDARHNRLLAVPALFYAINNYLKFSMQLFFRPTTTKMLGNLKIFTIALLMRTIMHRRFNVIQWEALFLLVAGITVNQLGTACPGALSGSHEAMPPLIPALLCTLGTVTVPSAASVYNEFALKRHMDTSVHLQNFFLYFYGLLFNTAALLVTCGLRGEGLGAMFAGQTWVTLLLVANNAAQGILSSFFYKFADTILKKYSSVLATIATAILSWALFGHALTVNFLLGVSIVMVSMHQFFTFGDKAAVGSDKGHHDASKGLVKQSPPPEGKSRMLFSPSLEHITIQTAANVLPGVNGGAAGGKGMSGAAGKEGPVMHSVTIGRPGQGSGVTPSLSARSTAGGGGVEALGLAAGPSLSGYATDRRTTTAHALGR